MKPDALKDHLIQNNGHFRSLNEKHQELEDRLTQMSQQGYRSEDDQVEETALKKRKLKLKEQMNQIMESQAS